MKTLFIEANYNKKIILPKEIVSKLPKKIGLVATTQFTNQLNDIKAQLDYTISSTDSYISTYFFCQYGLSNHY